MRLFALRRLILLLLLLVSHLHIYASVYTHPLLLSLQNYVTHATFILTWTFLLHPAPGSFLDGWNRTLVQIFEIAEVWIYPEMAFRFIKLVIPVFISIFVFLDVARIVLFDFLPVLLVLIIFITFIFSLIFHRLLFGEVDFKINMRNLYNKGPSNIWKFRKIMLFIVTFLMGSKFWGCYES